MMNVKKFFNLQNLKRYAMRPANWWLLSRLEQRQAPEYDKALLHRPIFVLGAPRCGSTLVMQVLTDVFDLGYLSNAHCLMFGYPSLAERLWHPLADKPNSNYRSRHGVTHGGYAPSEAEQWWYRFFERRPHYTSVDTADDARMRAMRRSVADMARTFDRPVIFKNLYAAMRLGPILKHLPESLFIVIHRHLLDNAHSLLEARLHAEGDYARWWSTEPREIEQLQTLPPEAQVVGQIQSIYRTIARDLDQAGVPTDCVLDLDYQCFCDNPSELLDQIESFLRRHEPSIQRLADPPAPFAIRSQVRIDPSLHERLVACCSSSLPGASS